MKDTGVIVGLPPLPAQAPHSYQPSPVGEISVPLPFEIPFDELRSELDTYVGVVRDCLDSGPVHVGDIVEDVLTRAGVSHRRTRLGEVLLGSCLTPDFVVPNAVRPYVVIDAAHAADDGTARDRVTRVEYLAALSLDGQPPETPKFEVIACIAGLGFGVRRTDMRHLLLATRGRTFTLRHMSELVSHTRLVAFRSSTESG